MFSSRLRSSMNLLAKTRLTDCSFTWLIYLCNAFYPRFTFWSCDFSGLWIRRWHISSQCMVEILTHVWTWQVCFGGWVESLSTWCFASRFQTNGIVRGWHRTHRAGWWSRLKLIQWLVSLHDEHIAIHSLASWSILSLDDASPSASRRTMISAGGIWQIPLDSWVVCT